MGYIISPVHEKQSDNLPPIKKSDEGKVLVIKNGKWATAPIEGGLAPDLSSLAKVAKSGSYKDLKNKPNLSDFAKKSEVEAAKEELKQEMEEELSEAIGQISSLGFEMVDELPAEGEASKIYLVPNPNSEAGDNVYQEFYYMDGSWELIGDTRMSFDVLSNGEIDGIWAGIV